MAIVGLNNKVGVKIATVDVSDHVSGVTLTRNFDELEVSAMGDFSHRFTKGLEASTITLDFFNDETSTTGISSILQANWGQTVTLTLLQDKTSAVSASNPLYTMSILVNKTTDINGKVAELSVQSVTFTVNSVTTVSPTGTF
jgi:hypothetical protein